jgi:hypothetical protein
MTPLQLADDWIRVKNSATGFFYAMFESEKKAMEHCTIVIMN